MTFPHTTEPTGTASTAVARRACSSSAPWPAAAAATKSSIVDTRANPQTERRGVKEKYLDVPSRGVLFTKRKTGIHSNFEGLHSHSAHEDARTVASHARRLGCAVARDASVLCVTGREKP